MPFCPVRDPDDPRLEPFRTVRDRDIAGRQGFIAEGEVVVRTLLSAASRFEPDRVLVSENRLPALRPLLAGAPCPVLVLPQPAMEQVVGFPIHRGLLAAGRRRSPDTTNDLLARLSGPALVVVMAGLANHDNVGGVFRNAAAFGAGAVLLDADSCDPLYRKAIRVSVGAALRVPFHHGGSADSLLDALNRHGFATWGLTPAGRVPLAEVRFPPRTALVLGAEGPGLPPALLARCRPLRIDMAPGFDSLNVATASGIALHAARASLGWAARD